MTRDAIHLNTITFILRYWPINQVRFALGIFFAVAFRISIKNLQMAFSECYRFLLEAFIKCSQIHTEGCLANNKKCKRRVKSEVLSTFFLRYPHSANEIETNCIVHIIWLLSGQMPNNAATSTSGTEIVSEYLLISEPTKLKNHRSIRLCSKRASS